MITATIQPSVFRSTIEFIGPGDNSALLGMSAFSTDFSTLTLGAPASDSTNYALAGDGDQGNTYLNAKTTVIFKISNVTVGQYSAAGFEFGFPVKAGAYLVGSLPSASTYAYCRSMVVDSTVDATAATFGAVVAGLGNFKVPVWSDGTNWRLG